MTTSAIRALGVLGVPLLAVAAMVVLTQTGVWTRDLGSLADLFPVVVTVAAVGLGLRFNRSRVVLASLSLAACGYVLTTRLGSASPQILADGAAVVAPLVLGTLAVLPERGMITTRGLVQLTALSIPVGFLYWLAQPGIGREPIVVLLDSHLVDPGWLNLAGLSSTQPGVLAAAIAVVFCAMLFFVRRSPLTAAFVLAQGCLFGAFELAARSESPEVFVGAGVLVLAVGVVQESYGMAYLDELTKIPGRRALNEELAKLPRNYAIAMLDVDHFKKFNDKHGHDVGDQVLKMVASKLRAVGGRGKAYRYGGEEFTIVFSGKSIDDAWEHLEAVRSTIETSKLTLRSKDRPKKKPKKRSPKKTKGRSVSVTISIGVAQRGGNHRTPHDVVEAADKALYRAKKKGRNQVAR